MKIEHLTESPFDSVLGVVTRLEARGKELWGTLRQPVAMWKLAQRAGVRALSVGLDTHKWQLLETSFVRKPRIARAQVFAAAVPGTVAQFEVADIFGAGEGVKATMASVRQLTEGLIAYLRGLSGEEEATQFAAEREALAQERAQLRAERVDQQIMLWKRQGRLRGTDEAERLARTLLMSGEENVVTFDGQNVPVGALFARFIEGNGPVVAMGERLPMAEGWRLPGQSAGATARERLVALAQEKARQDGLNYVQAFSAVANAHPELAQAAREA
jgi:hypothetical protein